MAKHPGDPTDFESFLTWEALTDILSYDPGIDEKHLGEFAVSDIDTRKKGVK